MTTKKIYVLDTNVFLSDFNCLFSFGKNDVVIPHKVLQEIDKHKKRPDSVGVNARRSIRILDELRAKGNFSSGIRIRKGRGMVFAMSGVPEKVGKDFDVNDADNSIVSVALQLQEHNPNRKVILVSKDVNVRIRCNALNVFAQDYTPEHIVKNTEQIYTGFTEELVDDAIVDAFYNNEKIFLENGRKIMPNSFVMLISNKNPKKTALTRFTNQYFPLRKVYNWNGQSDKWGIKPKNKEQEFALDLLMDENVSIVSLIGSAGSGKTLLSITAGLEQLKMSKAIERPYTKLIVSRPIQPLGRDLGYLPGLLEEKMAPWIAPIQDNLEFLFSQNDNAFLQQLYDKRLIEIEALTYIRGRSIQNAFIIIDEAQNLSRHEIKTILTRVGNGSKIVLTGDIHQIDATHLDETSSGLTYAVEKLKKFELTGHITLQKGERSPTATLAAKEL